MTTLAQADRLAEQIKRALAAYEIPAHVQSSVSEDLASLAALAKQQEAQPVISDGHLIAPTPIHPQPANPAKTCDGSLCMQSNRCSYTPCQSKNVLTPSAPQAAGEVLTDTRIGELSYFSVDVRGPRLDQFKFARAVEAEVLAKEREQAALPAPQEKELRRMLCAAIGGGLAYMDDGEAQFESIDFLRWPVDAIQSALKHRALRLAAIAQGTAPAAQEKQ